MKHINEIYSDLLLKKDYYLTKDLEKLEQEINANFLNLYFLGNILEEDKNDKKEIAQILIKDILKIKKYLINKKLIKIENISNFNIKLNLLNDNLNPINNIDSINSDSNKVEEYEVSIDEILENTGEIFSKITNVKDEVFELAFTNEPITYSMLKTFKLETQCFDKVENSIELVIKINSGKNENFLLNYDIETKVKNTLELIFKNVITYFTNININFSVIFGTNKLNNLVSNVNGIVKKENTNKEEKNKLELNNENSLIVNKLNEVITKIKNNENENEKNIKEDLPKDLKEEKEIKIDNLVNKNLNENNNVSTINLLANLENSIKNDSLKEKETSLENFAKQMKDNFKNGKVLVNGNFEDAPIKPKTDEETKTSDSSKTVNSKVGQNPNNSNDNKGSLKEKGAKKHIFGKMPYQKEIAESKIKSLNDYSGDVIVNAEILEIEDRKIREDLTLITFAIYDGTSAMLAKKFLKADEVKDAISRIKEHKGNNGLFKIYGNVLYDNFAKEITINMLGMIENGFKEETLKKDTEPVKRVELRCHTKMSQLDGVIEVKDLFKRVKNYGMNAVAVTDLGVVQSFPDSMYAAKGSEIKCIYGVDGFLTLDDSSAISFLKESSLDAEYCILDIETTGLSFRTDKITEFGILKVKNGQIIGEYETFVNPEVPIPEEVVKVTNITDDMVKDAPTIDKIMPQVKEFIGDSILVAHNADFDIGFIKYNAEKLGIEIDNMYIDTLRLAKQVYSELKRFKLGKIAEYLGIEVIVAHRALDDVKTLTAVFEKMIEKIKEQNIFTWQDFDKNWKTDEDAYKNYPMYNSTILVNKQIGMRNLYELISISHVNHFYVKPRILKSIFQKNRDGLIIGSGNNQGELFSAIKSGKTDEELMEIAEYYDFLEVQPPENEMPQVVNGIYGSLKDVETIIKKIIEIGEKTNKLVVATGDVFFLDPEDKIYREILHVGQKKRDAYNQPNLYFRTTNEMLDAFSFLGKDKAYEIVVTNSNKIADSIPNDILPISKEKSTPQIEGGDEMLRDMTMKKAYELYGNPLPEIVESRVIRELDSIINNGFSVMYMIAQKLVHKSNEDGYIVGSRGSVGSSLVAFMSGITEVNSLKPHYRCGNCKYSDFTDYGIMNGFDLPDKNCPNCNELLIKDGMDIPFETFLGFKGNKEPDIDLNFSDEYQSTAHKYTEEIIGDGATYKAGTIGTIADKTAFGYVKGYFDDKEIKVSNAEIARLAKGCTGVKRTTGQHPGGIIVVPAGREIYEFCPVQKPADKSDIDIITTHFDYHKIDHNLLKLDILGHLDPTMIRHLQDLTGINPTKIKLDDKETMSIFSSTNALGVTPEQINSKVGTYGIPEFGTKFVRDMLVDTRPTTFEELIRISGLSHGTDVWLNNAQDLVNQGIATLSQAICTRDDIMIYLINKGVESELSFTIMESVRKGKGLRPEWEEEMVKHDVPAWYIKSCKTIKYMFPKAHAAAYVTNSFRIAWFKVHKPAAYYTAYFTVRGGGDFDATHMIFGKEKIKQKMEELEKLPSMGVKEKGVYSICEMGLEMYERGIKFLPIDLYKSHAYKFQLIDDNTILPPLNVLPGLGTIAAENIYKEAQKEKFFTKEEMKLRCKIGNSTIELLDSFNILEGMLDSAQTSIFDMF